MRKICGNEPANSLIPWPGCGQGEELAAVLEEKHMVDWERWAEVVAAICLKN